MAWGIDNNLTRKLSAADPVQIALIKGLVAGTVNLGLGMSAGAHLPSIAMLGGAALVGYGVSLVLFAGPTPSGGGAYGGILLDSSVHRRAARDRHVS